MTPRRKGVASSLWLALGAGAALTFLVAPVLALLLNLSWAQFWAFLTSDQALPAIGLSLLTTLLATAACIVLGVPLAWWLARLDTLASYVRALVLLPLVLPPVAGGIALLTLLGRQGLLGSGLDWFGINLPFSTLAVILAQVFVALPFMTLASEAAFRSIPKGQLAVAQTLGASQWRRFLSVALPLSWPGLAAGALLSWARAFGEFGATVTFAGSLPGVTETLPLAVYRALETDQDAAIALSVVMVALSIGIVLVLSAGWIPWTGFAKTQPPRPRAEQQPDTIRIPEPGASDLSSGIRANHTAPAPNSHDVLQCHLSIHRPDFPVVVDLTLRPGEIVVITGPNGAGKTTLLAGIAGLVQGHSGEIRWGDVVWSDPKTRCAVQDRGIGYVPQTTEVFGHLSVVDNVAFGPRARGSSRKAARSIAREVLTNLDLTELGQRPGNSLSGGQAKQVAVARALAADPTVLLLDEPTAGLDTQARARFAGWLESHLQQCRIPTILVTHDMTVAEAVQTRTLLLDRGRLQPATPAAQPYGMRS